MLDNKELDFCYIINNICIKFCFVVQPLPWDHNGTRPLKVLKHYASLKLYEGYCYDSYFFCNMDNVVVLP
jgi:hypothetical protein